MAPVDHVFLTNDAKPFFLGVNITMFRWEIPVFAVVPLSFFLDEIPHIFFKNK